MKLPQVHLPHKTNKLTLKTLLAVCLVILAAIGITFITVAVVQDYRSEQVTKQKQHQAALAAQKQAGYKEGISDRLQYLAAYELMKLECQKGEAAYAKLTVAQKRTTQAVNCNQAVLQFP